MFKQVCVWPGTLLGDSTVAEFEQYFVDTFNVRVKYLEEIVTFPDKDEDGYTVDGTGGRNDIFFAVHNDDVMRFAIPKLNIGARWVEDALAGDGYKIYPAHVLKYTTW